MKKSIKLPYKAFSLLLALILVSVSVPIAFAADATALSTSNVTEWPTATFINEAMYFGQKVEDAVTLSGGKVEYNGQSVSGHFEFIDPTFMPTAFGTQRADIKFVPDDITLYTGFEAKRCRYVTYTVSKTTPVFVDEINDPLVATKVESGATLSTSTISGGKMVNPYNPNEPKILARSWEWSSPNTVVTESGYYEAKFIPGNYNATTAQIYVEIAVDIIESEILTVPTVPELTYDGVTTWNDVTLSGGVAVEKGTTNVIEGSFTLHPWWKSTVIDSGNYEIDVTFTPNDTEVYTKVDCKIPVTVSKAPIKFVDENGNEIVPEITVPYGTKFNDISRLLLPYVKGADYTLLSMGDLEYKQCEEGTYTVTASAPSDGKHYETTELTFKIVIEKIKINPSLKALPGEMYIEDNSAVYKPKGTFTIEYTIDGVEQTPITGIQYNTHFEWNPTKSGNYEYTVIYNEAEEERYIIDDFTASNAVTLSWGFSATGMNASATYRYGDVVTYTAPAIDETMKDKPYYVFSEWSEVKGIEMTDEQKSNPEVSFTMPDNDVELKASYKFSFKAFFEWVLAQITQFFTFIVNAVKDLIAMM